MFRLLNSHLQAYSLQVNSQDALHTLGSQFVYINEIKFVASQAKCIYLYKNLRAKVQRCCANIYFNPLTPNDLYMSRTAPLTSKRSILYIQQM